MKKNIVIFGSSGHAGVIVDIIKKQNKFYILGLLDDFKEKNTIVFGKKILGKIEDIVNFKVCLGIIGVGDNWSRYLIYNRIKKLVHDFSFITVVDKSSILSENVTIGQGTVIMPGVVVNNNSKIGSFCILNTKASLDHDSKLEDYSSLAPGVTTGGKVEIGEFSAISLGANIIQDVKIGKHTVVGAGSLVLKDIPEHTLAYGVPAKEIRKRSTGEQYL